MPHNEPYYGIVSYVRSTVRGKSKLKPMIFLISHADSLVYENNMTKKLNYIKLIKKYKEEFGKISSLKKLNQFLKNMKKTSKMTTAVPSNGIC